MALKQPKECYECGCPLAGVGTGFVLGSGDPEKASMALMLEAPGREELTYEVDSDELDRRRRAFPHLGEEFLRRGQPVVGRAGATLFQWGLAPLQIGRNSLFIDNGLRCLPPAGRNGPYPTGDIRKRAEACCRQWDRWREYKPTVSLVNIHPAAIARESTPLLLQIRTFEKAKDFAAQSEKPLVLCGGKATKVWMGYGENVTRWVGHYEQETDASRARREERRLEGLKVTVKEKGKKTPKLTMKSALTLLLSQYIQREDGTWGPNTGNPVILSDETYQQVAALIAPKVKKEEVQS